MWLHFTASSEALGTRGRGGGRDAATSAWPSVLKPEPREEVESHPSATVHTEGRVRERGGGSVWEEEASSLEELNRSSQTACV